MQKTIFLDTNVYLHYQDIDQVDWLNLVQSDSTTIVIPPITIRELNKRKDTPSRPRVRKRAGVIIKKLTELWNSDMPSQLKTGVSIRFEDLEPLSNIFDEYLLSREVQDDYLIASIIQYRNEVPGAEIICVTADDGLTLQLKAKRYEIAAIQLPDMYKLPEEPDPEQEEIRELEREIRELKAKIPRLSLVFEGGQQQAEFMLLSPLELKPTELESEREQIRKRYPKAKEAKQPSSTEHTDFNQVLSEAINTWAATANIYLISPEEITRYNTQLEIFYQEYEDYLRGKVWHENFSRRTIELIILLQNDGTEPAEDIDIIMHFPDGIQILEEESLPKTLEIPKPPTRPRSELEIAIEPLMRATQSYDVHPSFFSPHNLGVTNILPNVSLQSIKKTNSYEVEYHVQRVKHHLQEQFHPLYIFFDTFEEARSFHVDYRLLASNVPSADEGKLHIIIHKEDSKT